MIFLINKRSDIIKFYKKILFVLLLLVCTFSVNLTIKADSGEYVILGGDAIGLDLNTGVFVTGKFDTGSQNNIIKGDNLIKIDETKITCVEDLKTVISKKEVGTKAIVEFIRNGLTMKTSLTVSEKEGKHTIGLYVKDNVLGVGTLTYVVPETMAFGSLGHSACSDTVNISGGTILKCYINGINKGIKGIPGEKRALLDKETIGKVKINNDFGLFGTMNNFEYSEDELIKVAKNDKIKLGKATIKTVIKGYDIEEYEIEIVEIKKQNRNETKGIKFIVTDNELISKTGGIIQGMSGSPIIQNNELVGAVSHVIINDPTVGYGVFAEWMLNYTK